MLNFARAFSISGVALTTLAIACGDDGTSGSGASGTGTGGSGAAGTGGSASSATSSGGGGNGNGGSTSTNMTTTTTGAGGGIECDEPGGQIPALKATPVVSGLSAPVFVTAPPGDNTRLFVVELGGTIRVVENGTLVPGNFLDISGDVLALEYQGDERGLFSMAFHPNYAQNGRFFVFHTNSANDNIVEEFARSANDPNKANPTRVKQLVMTNPSAANHNGGMIAFGTDGKLYVGTGDGGNGGDPDFAQDTGNLYGKILRIDVDTFPTPVPGNLAGHVWDRGLRNPWRFSFDSCKGDLYIGDVGQNAIEEINVELKDAGGKNYGWPIVEGDQCYQGGCDMSAYDAPAITHSHNDSITSITGGYVYRGSMIPALRGTYIYGDFGSNTVFSFRYSGGQATAAQDIPSLSPSGGNSLASFGEDAAGNLYIVNIGGSVARIDAE